MINWIKEFIRGFRDESAIAKLDLTEVSKPIAQQVAEVEYGRARSRRITSSTFPPFMPTDTPEQVQALKAVIQRMKEVAEKLDSATLNEKLGTISVQQIEENIKAAEAQIRGNDEAARAAAHELQRRMEEERTKQHFAGNRNFGRFA